MPFCSFVATHEDPQREPGDDSADFEALKADLRVLNDEEIVEAPIAMPSAVSRVNFITSNSVRTDLANGSTAGSTSASGTAVFVGRFGHMLWGVRARPVVIPLRERYRNADQFGFVLRTRVDFQHEYPGAFATVAEIHASTL